MMNSKYCVQCGCLRPNHDPKCQWYISNSQVQVMASQMNIKATESNILMIKTHFDEVRELANK